MHLRDLPERQRPGGRFLLRGRSRRRLITRGRACRESVMTWISSGVAPSPCQAMTSSTVRSNTDPLSRTCEITACGLMPERSISVDPLQRDPGNLLARFGSVACSCAAGVSSGRSGPSGLPKRAPPSDRVTSSGTGSSPRFSSEKGLVRGRTAAVTGARGIIGSDQAGLNRSRYGTRSRLGDGPGDSRRAGSSSPRPGGGPRRDAGCFEIPDHRLERFAGLRSVQTDPECEQGVGDHIPAASRLARPTSSSQDR